MRATADHLFLANTENQVLVQCHKFNAIEFNLQGGRTEISVESTATAETYMNWSNFYEFQLNHNKMMSLPQAREPRIRKLEISLTVTEVILPQIDLKNKLPPMRAQHKNKQQKKRTFAENCTENKTTANTVHRNSREEILNMTMTPGCNPLYR